MPAGVVRTLRDEHLWSKAKRLAKGKGYDDYYAYVMGIFKKMKGMSDYAKARKKKRKEK